jgi:hypothetical protein
LLLSATPSLCVCTALPHLSIAVPLDRGAPPSPPILSAATANPRHHPHLSLSSAPPRLTSSSSATGVSFPSCDLESSPRVSPSPFWFHGTMFFRCSMKCLTHHIPSISHFLQCQILRVWCPTSSTLISNSLFFLLSR